MARNPGLRRRRQALLICAATVLATLLGASSALADGQSGTHGHYVVTDNSSHPGVTCNYTPDYPNHYLMSLTVRAPSVWWPNTSSSNRTEHGSVSWLPIVQRLNSSGWKTVVSGTKQQAVAYEDRPLHDAADKAPFTTQTVAWTTGTAELYRVVIKAYWYAANSSVMGQVKHVVKQYRLAYPGYSAASPGACSGRLTILG